jgi:hypothetical protein
MPACPSPIGCICRRHGRKTQPSARRRMFPRKSSSRPSRRSRSSRCAKPARRVCRAARYIETLRPSQPDKWPARPSPAQALLQIRSFNPARAGVTLAQLRGGPYRYPMEFGIRGQRRRICSSVAARSGGRRAHAVWTGNARDTTLTADMSIRSSAPRRLQNLCHFR